MEDYEDFNEQQLGILSRYVTSTSSNVFVLCNLPEVIKGALFSRYSRSSLGLRALLLKEFIGNEEIAFESIVGKKDEKAQEIQIESIKKAQNFYDRILDGYGDDSIGELGGAHLALENISMLAAKVIQDSRIGGSPLEKSTRYIYFDQKIRDEYLFYREPILMTSAFRNAYIETCNMLFDTYSKLIVPMTALIEEQFPKDAEVSKVAYRAALRAKVLDCLRGLLPTSALTNMGVFGNGRFFEGLIHKLHCHNLAEMEILGKKCFDELSKVMPSFVRRADVNNRHHKAYSDFFENMAGEIKLNTARYTDFSLAPSQAGTRLISYDSENVVKVASALLFTHSTHSLDQLLEHCRRLPEDAISCILDAACNARENRRHKSPRALEHATFTFEVIADFGCYRDLQRHRMLTQDRQLLSCDYGYTVPVELRGTDMEEPYCMAMDKAKEVYETIAAEFPEEAQYTVPMGYNIRWYFHVNLRALQWLCELRSSPAGHPNYRLVAQQMARAVATEFPQFERFFKFVDFEGYELGRLGQEQRIAGKRTVDSAS